MNDDPAEDPDPEPREVLDAEIEEPTASLVSLDDAELAAMGPQALALEVHRTQRALVTALEQGHREAAASRAQARELIRSLDRIQRTQEYLGTTLRDERRRARWLTAVMLLAPLAAAALVWAAWVRYESGQERLHTELVAALERPTPGASEAATPPARPPAVVVEDGRVDALRTDLDRLKGELGASQDELEQERERARERESRLSGRLRETERELGEVAGLRSELERVRERAAAEAARSDRLERDLERSERGEPTSVAQPVAGGAAKPREEPVAAKPAPGSAGDEVPGDEVPGAVREEDALETLRGRLNGLLGKAHGAVRYEFESLGGASGGQLVDVRVTGRDSDGLAIRSIEAPLAEVSVDRRKRRALLRFSDGHLIVGKTRAPFFEGSYGLLIDVEPEAWRRSGLTVVRFH